METRKRSTLASDLAELGFTVGAVHGDLPQHAREKALAAFRRSPEEPGSIDVLVATDVAARGIDVDDVTHVINYQTPDDPMTYVHRIGRTGRAGHSGVAITLVALEELDRWSAINTELNLDKEQLPEWFSTSPELHQVLGLSGKVNPRVGAPRPVYGMGPSSRERAPRSSRPRSRKNRRA